MSLHRDNIEPSFYQPGLYWGRGGDLDFFKKSAFLDMKTKDGKKGLIHLIREGEARGGEGNWIYGKRGFILLIQRPA